jgi:signal transduction histidine kinase
VAALKEAYKKYQKLIVAIGPLPSEIAREFDKKMVLDFIVEDIDEIVKENQEGIDKIVQIVSDLKSFTHSNPEAVFIQADFNKAVKNTITVTRNECKYVADVKCSLAELPAVPCNLREINQVLLNILVNAAQAIRSQKRGAKGLIQIATFDEPAHIRCEITDDGPGILPENLNRIFEPFFTTKPPGEGTGLGLSISYDIIVNKHRGEFLVESALGHGTKFIIKLPKKQN